MDKKPNPGVGFRLLFVGENLKGSHLWLGHTWETWVQDCDLYEYTRDMEDSGLYYRIAIEDPDATFEKWFGGLMLEPEPNYETSARMAWHAAREYYQTK